MNVQTVAIKYITADGKRIYIEVSMAVKELLEQSDRQIRSQRRQDRRHLDYGEFIDELTDAAMRNPQTIDTADLVIRMESFRHLRFVMTSLSKVQLRRTCLCYDRGLTHQQIAIREQVNRSAVSRSITAALKKLRKLLRD